MDKEKAPTTHIDEVEHRRQLAERANAAMTDRMLTISVANPGASENITLAFLDRQMAITHMFAVLVGSSTPSVTWEVRYDADRSATGSLLNGATTTTTSVTSGDEVLAGETIETNSYVWLETTAQSGTVAELHVTLYLSEVR